MKCQVFATILFLVLSPAVVATTYTQYTGNAYKSTQTGNFGGSSLDHCERSNSTFDECKHWCTVDCECECFTVYTPNGACFRRHSCDPSLFNTGNADFQTYVKDNFTSNCTNFEDLGYDTQCAGAAVAPLTATNIGSLENCKSLCTLLSFECKGIQYLSNCSDTTMDQCLIYTSAISSATPTTPHVAQVSHYHCLKFIGEEGNLTGGLIIPLKVSLLGFDGTLLAGQQIAADLAGSVIKGIFANASSHVTNEHVNVQIHPISPAVTDIFIEVQNETAFSEVVSGLQAAEDTLKAQFLALLSNSDLDPFKISNQSLQITDFIFNFSQIEFLTSTITMSTTTETTTPCTENCTTTTTSGTDHGTHYVPMWSTMLMWFAVRLYHA